MPIGMIPALHPPSPAWTNEPCVKIYVLCLSKALFRALHFSDVDLIIGFLQMRGVLVQTRRSNLSALNSGFPSLVLIPL